MLYDPEKHDRRSLRLRGYDYTQSRAYFVTVCVQGHVCLLGRVAEGAMRLSAAGEMIDTVWHGLPDHYPGVSLDAFVVMPNHVHGIVVIVPSEMEGSPTPHGYNALVGAQRAAPLRKLDRGGRVNVPPKSLGAIVRAFKSAATRRINQLRDTPGAKVWQRNYHDHILRSERAWRAHRRYIKNNPRKWPRDAYHPDQSS